ncbi:homing endonuclease associated repeat-containing protein [Natrinema sp. H-ect4]|uniref:homing endonuclease associated repeat-containing protein n=1 Tax=Natrinema sp. H-ect4 TaxID=3242699 RepID=UPI0035A8B8F8
MTTEEECLEALQRAAEQLGESPTKAQYEELGLTPASATIIRTCGGWNDAKELAGLETSYSRGPRVGSKPDDVDLPAGMSWEELSVDQGWHYRNTEWNRERTLHRRSRLRSWVNDQKRERGCSQCGVDTVACLDFHHIDETAKQMAVGRMITFGYGKDALRDEIEKCDVLCANCHRKLHYTLPKQERRRWVHDQKRDVGCDRCAESDPACLDFHHSGDEKQATVSKLVANGQSKERIQTEIDRCCVLCANCHRTEHYEPPMSYSSH